MKRASFVLVSMVILFSCQESDRNEVVPEISDERFHHNAEVQTLFENDPDGINLIFLGDGFIREDLKVGGVYEQKATELIQHIFTVPPFSTYQKYFNAYIVYTESKQRLLDGKNTLFSTKSSSILEVGNYNNIDYYVSKAVPSLDQAHMVVMLANTTQNCGLGNNNVLAHRRVAATSIGTKAKEIVVHEVGHTFGYLADEYINNHDGSVDLSPWSFDTYANVDHHNDLDNIKWAHFIGQKGYEAVGAYEGGLYVEKEIWRPESTSIMQARGADYFNAPSREAIVKRIFAIKGIPYSFEEFLKTDVIPTPFNARLEKSENWQAFNCQYEN